MDLKADLSLCWYFLSCTNSILKIPREGHYHGNGHEMTTHFLENKINNDDISIEESSRTALLISKVKLSGVGRWELGGGGLKYGFMDITLLP